MSEDAPSGTDRLPSENTLPTVLVERNSWVCWREKRREGKLTKIPIDPDTGRYASATDQSTWGSFQAARERAEADALSGLGFVFTEADPIVGVDLDDCRVPETGTMLDWAERIVETLDSYTEVSPSGTGVHVLVEGTLPGDRSRKGDVEIYETARFFTVTGDHVSGTPETIEPRDDALADVYHEFVEPERRSDDPNSDTDRSVPEQSRTGAGSTGDSDDAGFRVDLSDEALLSKARNAANGEKFERLWAGDTTGYESQSEADMALCALLAFWTGSDTHRMDRLFRESGLLREKWDEVHFADGSTYGEKTVERAAMAVSDHYEPENASRNDRKRTDSESDEIGAPSVDSSRSGKAESRTPERADVDDSGSRALLETIQTLEAEVEALRAENESLRNELAAERAARTALEDGNSRDNTESARNGFWSLFGF